MTAGDIRVRPTRVRRMRVQTRDGDHHESWHSLHDWLYKRGDFTRYEVHNLLIYIFLKCLLFYFFYINEFFEDRLNLF